MGNVQERQGPPYRLTLKLLMRVDVVFILRLHSNPTPYYPIFTELEPRMQHIRLSQLDSATRSRLEEAVTLAACFDLTRNGDRRLTLGGDGEIVLNLGGRPASIKLIVGGFLVTPTRSYVALTWGKTIRFRNVANPNVVPYACNSLFLYPRDGTDRSSENIALLLLHELVHVEQQHNALLGLPGFLAAYILGWIQGGFRYGSNPYELRAYELQETARLFFSKLRQG
jgi:hypothetical protein